MRSAYGDAPAIEATRDDEREDVLILALSPMATSRFGDEKGTNPEELIGAAHASCFSMALSNELSKAGIAHPHISTTATVEIKQQDGGFAITKSALTLRAKIPGIDEATFRKHAEGAEKNCPVSKVLNAEITLDAKLV